MERAIIPAMQTKLSRLCEKIIEAGWLAALVVTPLFFNVFSSRVFEPDKLTTLRSIALVMVFAWVVKVIEDYRSAEATFGIRAGTLAPPTAYPLGRVGAWISGTPLVAATLILAGVYLLATITSVAPRLSLWGSYQRLQGTYTTLSYMAIFLLMLGHLRTREQVERIVTTAILTSLPIALYGIVQHYGLDPLPWLGDVQRRVASTMGNSIFVAAYLIMVVPLTLNRLVAALGVMLEDTETNIANFILAACYIPILGAQIFAIVFSQSRGPWLGLLGAVYVFVLFGLIELRRRAKDRSRLAAGEVSLAVILSPLSVVLALIAPFWRKSWRWAWLSWISAAILGIGIIVAMNLPNSPLSFVRQLPYVGRLGQILETESGTGKVRVLIWEGTVNLVTNDPLRLLIGYGPETMHVAYNPFYPPDLAHIEARNASPDRSHNETWDSLVITGIIGFLAYLFLFTSLFYFALKWLGLIPSPRHRNLFVGLWLAGGLVVVLIMRVWDGSWKFFGVGLPAGMMLGLFAYLAWFAFSASSERLEQAESPYRWLLTALLAAIVAHFIEIHFGIAIAATRTYFWIYAGLLVFAGFLYQRQILDRFASLTTSFGFPILDSDRTEAQNPKSKTRGERSESIQNPGARRRQRRPVPRRETGRGTPVVSGSSFALSRLLLANCLIVGLILVVMVCDFTAPGLELFEKAQMLWLFALTWIFGGAIAVAEAARQSGRNPDVGGWLASLGVYVAISLVCPLTYAIAHGLSLSPGNDLANTLLDFYFFLFATMIILGVVLLREEALPSTILAGLRSLAAPAIVVVVILLILATNVDPVRADVYYKQAWVGFHQKLQYDPAISLYKQALQLAPDQDFYLLFLGKAYLEKGEATSDQRMRDALFEQARTVLEEARTLNPLNTDHTANLARMHQIWASVTTDPATRDARLKKALEYYEQALQLSPNAAHLHNEWGTTYYLLGDYEKALSHYQTSLRLDDRFEQTYLRLGDLYRTQQKWDPAIDYYRKALNVNPRSVAAHSALGFVYSQQGRLDLALQENQAVVTLAPNDASGHRNLALIYEQLGRIPEALDEARKALQITPGDKALQEFIKELEAAKPK